MYNAAGTNLDTLSYLHTASRGLKRRTTSPNARPTAFCVCAVWGPALCIDYRIIPIRYSRCIHREGSAFIIHRYRRYSATIYVRTPRPSREREAQAAPHLHVYPREITTTPQNEAAGRASTRVAAARDDISHHALREARARRRAAEAAAARTPAHHRTGAQEATHARVHVVVAGRRA